MIAGKLLIRPLAVQHDLDARIMRGLENMPLRMDRGTAIGLILKPGDFRRLVKDILRPRKHPVRQAARGRHYRFHERSFIHRFFGETSRDRARLARAAQFARHEAYDG